MSESDIAKDDSTNSVQLWDPRRSLRRMEVHEERLSRGFLRCRPEKWFPGFASQWLPLAHALGWETRIAEVRPVAYAPRGCDTNFVGRVDGELLLISLDHEACREIADEVVPGALRVAEGVVLEYFARRFLVSLATSWSGPESSAVNFEAEIDPSDVVVAGAVKVSFAINTSQCTVWVGLRENWVERLDGLWRRQVRSSARTPNAPAVVHLEIAQLAVPPQMLADYLKRGTVIDLEVRASDTVTLRLGSKPWMPARLVDVGGMFGCEIAPGALSTPALAEGTTRLSVVLGSAALEPSELAELAQAGAVHTTKIPTSEKVILVINEDKVAEGRLCVYEGRFAIEVQ